MDYALTLTILLSVYVLLAYALDTAMGHAGLLAAGIGAYVALGAYASSLLSLHAGVPVWLAIMAAAAVAGMLSTLIAFPLLRSSGDYFFLASIALQVIVVDVLGNLDAITGGPHGIAGIPKPALAGWLPANVEQALAYVLVCALTVLAMRRVLSRGFGTSLRAARDDAVAALSFGIPVTWLRARALGMSAAAAAAGGALLAHHVSYIDPTTFSFAESVYVLSMVAVGGASSPLGPLVGGALLILLPEALRFVGGSAALDANLRQLLYGALLVAFAFWRPQGLTGRPA